MYSPIRIWWISVATLSLILLFGTAATHAQQAIHVPADQPTIQAAINAANNGDTVIVAPGTYVENINFNGKAITVTSSGGPSVTTIDGGANGSVVKFSTGETASSVLSGFTIRNGLQDGFSGGGIYISSASPTITGNLITANHAAVGCGIYVDSGSPLIQNNTITGNDQTGAGDGGQGGGGILVYGSSGSPTNPQIIGNTITNNSVAVGGDGGGISVGYYSSPLIQGNLIQGNQACGSGGGVALESLNTLILVDNLIVNNTALACGSGGGLYVLPGDLTQIINNTIAANSAYDNTSAVYVTDYGQRTTFTNNIFVAAAGQNAVTCSSLYRSSPALSYNDAFAASGSAWAGICDITSNPGNVSVDPLFMSAANGDFHLQAASPAIDAGNNSAAGLPNTDFDGNPRIAGAAVDLGVYEVVPTSTANLSPASLSFSLQAPSTSSGSQTATLTSTGTTPFQITSVQITGAFSESTTCPTLKDPAGFSGISGGNSCAYSVTFTPPSGSSPGTFTGALTVNGTNGASLIVSLSGTLGIAYATMSPSSLSFPSQVVGTTSSAQSVTLTNPGNFSLAITSITASQQFSESDNCGTSLAAGASCVINVTFAPSSAGTVSGTLTVTGNAANGPQSVTLGGTGLAPSTVSLSPSYLTFPDTQVGSTSATQTITLTNTSGASLNITGINSPSGFIVPSQNCVGTLAGGASCQMNVAFQPTTSGVVTGSLQVTDNASSSPQSVALGGNGIAPPPAVSLSPSSLTFPDTQVGSTSAPQTITLANTGGSSLNISSFSYPNAFSVNTNCSGPLGAGASCQITVAFKPTANGPVSGVLQITDNASGSPQSAVLSGTGIAPAAVSLSPSSLSFSAPLGTSSASQAITVTNSGGAALGISGIAANLPFAIMTSTCTGTLAGGASCSVNISFTPQASGSVTGAFTITDNASGSPQSVPLTGITPAAVSLSPSSLTFSGQAIGTTSAAQTVTLTNTGGAGLSISTISTSQPFAQTNNCPASLAGGTSCTINVTFTPQSSGSASGAVSITDNASGSPQSVTLTGTTPAVASLSSSLTFPATLIGATTTQTVTLTNTGGASMNITGMSSPNPFSVPGQNCLGTLAGGASCQISVAFKPTASGPVSGVLQITDTASGSPHSVQLSGTGVAPAAVSFSASSLSFGTQLVTTTSAAQAVTVTNTGGASLSINSIATSQPFAETNNCPASVAGGASCTINVTFTPQASGAVNGVLTITDSAAGSPQSVSLAGTGAVAAPTLSPASLSFGNQMVGTSSGNQTVKLTANGPGPLAISSISVSVGFTETSNCPASLNPGASCNISIAFQPSTAGAITGTLTIVDNGVGSPHTVSLSGTGLDFSVAGTPSSVSINSGAHANYTVTVSGLGGSFNHNVSLSCSGLPAQSSCSFSPSGLTPGSGSVNSALTIKTAHANGTSGTQPGTYTITITGKSDPLAHSTTVTLVVN